MTKQELSFSLHRLVPIQSNPSQLYREGKNETEEECGLSDQLHKADVETQMRQVHFFFFKYSGCFLKSNQNHAEVVQFDSKSCRNGKTLIIPEWKQYI